MIFLFKIVVLISLAVLACTVIVIENNKNTLMRKVLESNSVLEKELISWNKKVDNLFEDLGEDNKVIHLKVGEIIGKHNSLEERIGRVEKMYVISNAEEIIGKRLGDN